MRETNVYCYEIHGLHLSSTIRLPELVSALTDTAAPDIELRSGNVAVPLLSKRSSLRRGHLHVYHYGPKQTILQWEGIGAFDVTDGRSIVVDPHSGVSARLIRLPLLSLVMAVVLYQRGLLVLHASAVAIGHVGIAFAGRKGAGKSTTSAGFHAHGYRVVTDDFLAIDVDRTPITVRPAFPQLRLWPEAATAVFGDDPEYLPRLHTAINKRGRSVREGFQTAPVPLSRIYILDESDHIQTRRLRTSEALVEIIGQTYGQAFLAGTDLNVELFGPAVKLVERVPIWRLRRAPSLDRLSESIYAVEADLDRDPSARDALRGIHRRSTA